MVLVGYTGVTMKQHFSDDDEITTFGNTKKQVMEELNRLDNLYKYIRFSFEDADKRLHDLKRKERIVKGIQKQ